MAHYVLIDANNLAFAAQSIMLDKKGQRLYSGDQETTAINGLLGKVRETQRRFPDGHLLMLWDTGRAWRYGIFPEYKGNRKENPQTQAIKEALNTQFPLMSPLFDAAGIPQVTAENYEADDIAAGMADVLSNAGHRVTLVTRDRDWLQMVRPNVNWFDKWADKLVTYISFETDVGFPSPGEYSEAKILQGDGGDNVSGINGIGPSASEALVRQFGTAEQFIDGWRAFADGGGLIKGHPLRRCEKKVEEFLVDEDAARAKMALNRQLMDLRIMYGNKGLFTSIRKTKGAIDKAALAPQLLRLAMTRIYTNMDGWLAPFDKTQPLPQPE